MTEAIVEFIKARWSEDEGSVLSGECRCGDGPKRPDCADRVLAEVESKRRLLDWLDEVDRTCDNEDLTWWRLGGHFDTDHARSLLALPYVEHEDYQEEWRV